MRNYTPPNVEHGSAPLGMNDRIDTLKNKDLCNCEYQVNLILTKIGLLKISWASKKDKISIDAEDYLSNLVKINKFS